MAKKKVDPLEGKVLVPKPNKLLEFKAVLLEIDRVANGHLGWKGQADMFYSLDFEAIFNYKLKAKTKKGKLKEIEMFLKQSFMDRLMEVSEWLPEGEAETRMQSINTLYSDDIK